MRFGLRWLACVLLAVSGIAADFAIMSSTATAQSAQDETRRPGLLRGLFMRREPERVERRVVRPRAKRQRQAQRPSARRQREANRQPSRRKKETARASAASSEPQAAPKLDNARTVLVVGDFLGGGLAEGLETVFAERPNLRVVDRTSGSSGFVRDDFYDWPAEIGAMLESDAPAVVVVMIGSNDRQQIRTGGGNAAVRSPEWTAEYETRIRNFTTSISEKEIPLVWVGMPAFKSSSMSSDMLAFNDIYRRAAESTPRGVFVDIWDGFVDENGVFVTDGPDINGQPVRLRASDGINLTGPGRRKMAFYAEKPLERILGDTASPQDAAVPQAGMMGPEIPPGLNAAAALSVPEVNRTMPISLNDPELDGGAELLGAAVDPLAGEPRTPAERQAADGVLPPPPPGRADNFLRRQTAQPTAAAAAPNATSSQAQ